MAVSLTEFYRVLKNRKVFLTIKIGHGQVGDTTVKLGPDTILQNHKNTLRDYEIGLGKELHGKTLICTTTVADVRQETNKTSVTYELEGGARPYQSTMKKTVDKDGDVELYVSTFRFYV